MTTRDGSPGVVWHALEVAAVVAHLRVERSAETPRLAFDAAFAVLERQLERYRERDRDNKRHPKKYFAARRGLIGETSRPAKRARRA
jgi:sigma 54 modulation/S30EA-like ribosomal protein